MKPTKKVVHHFSSYFRREVERVLLLAEPEREDGQSSLVLHKKTLLCAMFDALARLHSPAEGGNRRRFLKLLDDHGNWPDADFVSLPILAERLDKQSETTPLRQFVQSRLLPLENRRDDVLDVATADISLGTLEDAVPDMTKEDRDLVEKCQHRSLFYAYRNFLVHEFREPGYAMEFFEDGPKPIYHHYLNIDGWRLLYPLSFFARIVQNAVAGLQKVWKRTRVDPYSRVTDSTPWET